MNEAMHDFVDCWHDRMHAELLQLWRGGASEKECLAHLHRRRDELYDWYGWWENATPNGATLH